MWRWSSAIPPASSDLFKFQIAGRSGIGKVGVLVVATAAVTRLFDSAVATYEQAVNLLPYMKIG